MVVRHLSDRAQRGSDGQRGLPRICRRTRWLLPVPGSKERFHENVLLNIHSCPSQKKPKETWWFCVIWCPEWDPEQRKKLGKIWINYGLQLSIQYDYWFTNCKKCTVWIWDVSHREIEFQICESSLYYLLSFPGSLKLLWKLKPILKGNKSGRKNLQNTPGMVTRRSQLDNDPFLKEVTLLLNAMFVAWSSIPITIRSSCLLFRGWFLAGSSSICALIIILRCIVSNQGA